MTNIPLVFVTEIKTSKTVSFCSVSVSAEDCGSVILMWSDITLYLFAVDRLKHVRFGAAVNWPSHTRTH